ncbi:MAG: peptidoglycan-binding protein, partial [Clostridia bacterium]|nr:peptidoglycan-binding protein [Clostridia bacterium]
MSVDGVAGPSTLKSLLGNDYKEFFDLAASRSSSSSSSSSSNEEEIVQAEVKVSSNGELSGALVMGVTDDLVNLVQERLKTYGFLSIDATTNYFGEMTEDAVIAFQKANGLTSDGIVGNKT